MATGSTSDMNFEKFDFDSVATSSNYIDRGAFGEVYGPFIWNSKNCAFKRIWISAGRSGNDFKTKVEANRNIWTSVKQNNLIEIYDVILEPKTLYIVMEYASGGSIRRLLDNTDATVHRQIDVSNWATQIAKGMLYLHEHNIVHRDLKSNNIMLMHPFDSVYPRKEMTLKITDFDDVREHNRTTTMSLRGTVAYTAPEVLKTERFSKASDVWSYGVIVWEMLTGGHPHEDVVDGALMLKALTGQLTLSVPESIPKSYKELLCGCLHQDKDRRQSFEGIIVRLNTLGLKEDIFRSEYKSDPVLVWTLRTKASEEEEKKSIRGMTILDKELFVVSKLSSEVEVYDSMEFSFSRRWNLKELIYPTHIASCNRNKCLYIFDFKGFDQSNEILRVDPNGKLLRKWSTGGNYGYGLSVNDDLNVILTVVNEHKLNEYSPDGQLIREINLSGAGILHPCLAIKLTNGHFVVSHGYDDDLHRVCVVDADGQLKKSFGGKRSSTIGQTKYLGHLSVAGNGFVMVVDRRNSRVLLLDSDLEPQREILSERENHGLQKPTRILLDKSTGRLFVADNELRDPRIVIFEFK